MEAAARKHRQLNECLLWAAGKNNLEKLKYYLSEGARVDKEDAYKRTSLIKAVQHGNIDAFELLISYGASVNKQDVDGETALIHASYKGYFDIVSRLIELGADINHKNKNDETATYIASKYGNYDCVRRLVTVGADYNIKSTFNKSALDVAIESMRKAQRQKRDDVCMQLERIVELLSDEDGIQVLQKEEKMFSLTPEEFRTCLERSEYRPSGINVRVIGLNDHSTMAVTRALLRRSSYSSDDSHIDEGIRIDDGYCEINIETGEWITHDKTTENEVIYRQIGEVVRNYVNTHNFKDEQNAENHQMSRKLSVLFRSNTTMTDTRADPFGSGFPTGSNDQEEYPPLGLQRSLTSASLYSLKAERSVVSLSGMDLLLPPSSSQESFIRKSSLPTENSRNIRQMFRNARRRVSTAAQSARQRLDALMHHNNRNRKPEQPQTMKSRKQVYETFEKVKREMRADHSRTASVSVCSLSGNYDFTALHRRVFPSSAIYVIVMDTETGWHSPCCPTLTGGIHCTNKEYMEFLMHLIIRRNGILTEEKSKVLFVLLHGGDENETIQMESDINSWLLDEKRQEHLLYNSAISLTFEELYSEKFSVLTQNIAQHAGFVIDKRNPIPANWLILKEAMCSTHESIISKQHLKDKCIDYGDVFCVPSKHGVKGFLEHMRQNGKILEFSLDESDAIILDITLLFRLIKFLKQSKIVAVNDCYHHTSLAEKLSSLSGNFDSMKSTTCYVDEEDMLWKVATQLCLVSTDLLWRPNIVNSKVALHIPCQVVSNAPETLALQFNRLDRTAFFRIRTNFSNQLKFIFDAISSTFFSFWPVKEIHSKPVSFRNLIVFTIDSHHFVSLSIDLDGNSVDILVTRTDMNATASRKSKYIICNGICRITKQCLTQIFYLTLALNDTLDYTLEIPTCSSTPSCMDSIDDLEGKTSYACPSHGIAIDPAELLEIWKYCKVDDALRVEECSLVCSGLSSQSLSEAITDIDFYKVIARIQPSSRSQLLASITKTATTFDAPVYNLDETLLRALIRWRNTRQRKFEDLQKLLVTCGETKHVLCKMHREQKRPAIENANRLVKIESLLLNQLSVRLTCKCMFIALYVGLDVVEYDRLLQTQRQNVMTTTRHVLSLLNGRTLDDIVAIFNEVRLNNDNLNEILHLIQRAHM